MADELVAQTTPGAVAAGAPTPWLAFLQGITRGWHTERAVTEAGLLWQDYHRIRNTPDGKAQLALATHVGQMGGDTEAYTRAILGALAPKAIARLNAVIDKAEARDVDAIRAAVALLDRGQLAVKAGGATSITIQILGVTAQTVIERKASDAASK